jgi:integrase
LGVRDVRSDGGGDAQPERRPGHQPVAAFGCLRWGELAALERQDVDADVGTVRVRQAYNEVRGVGLVLGPPKSRAGLRTVALPAAALPAIRAVSRPRTSSRGRMDCRSEGGTSTSW